MKPATHVKVQLKLDGTGTKLLTIPPVVIVNPGDTVEWKCDDGDITLTFEGGLFEGEGRFQSKKGHSTEQGQVHLDVARKKHFDCKVTFNGKLMPITYGVDTSGVGD